MSDREALLRAVIDAPQDDAPRLVYADWCEENGEAERAQVIRRQCEVHRRVRLERERYAAAVLAGGPLPAWPPSCYPADPELGTVSRQFPTCRVRAKLRWQVEPYIGRFTARTSELVMHRGFIEVCYLRWSQWLAHGPALTREHPVRYVHLIGSRLRHTRETGAGGRPVHRCVWASLPRPLAPLVPTVAEECSDKDRWRRRRTEMSDLLITLARDDFRALTMGQYGASRASG